MKVEKCPRCGSRPENQINKQMKVTAICWCHVTTAYTVRGALHKFNRWARREAKRIAKDGKGK